MSSSQNSDFPSSISHRAPQGEALTVLETKLIVLLSRQESPAVEALPTGCECLAAVLTPAESCGDLNMQTRWDGQPCLQVSQQAALGVGGSPCWPVGAIPFQQRMTSILFEYSLHARLSAGHRLSMLSQKAVVSALRQPTIQWAGL